MKNISQDNLRPGRDSTKAPPEYEARALPLSLPVRCVHCYPSKCLEVLKDNMKYLRGLEGRDFGSSWEMPDSSVDLPL
jgi:hypothetical protein